MPDDTTQDQPKGAEQLAELNTKLTAAQADLAAASTRIKELQAANTSHEAAITNLTGERDEAKGFKEQFETSQTELKQAREHAEGLTSRIQAGLVGRLKVYGLTDEELKNRSLEVLEGMEVALLKAQPQKPGGTTGLGLQGGGGGSPSTKPKTGLEQAKVEIAALMAAPTPRSEAVKQ